MKTLFLILRILSYIVLALAIGYVVYTLGGAL